MTDLSRCCSFQLVITSFFEFQERVRADQSKTLALDFSGVPYIDSSGIGALVSIYASRQKDGRRLLLVGVQPRNIRNQVH